MTEFSEAIGRIPAPAAYLLIAVALLAESVLLVGAFIPTLTLLLTAGALAKIGHLDLIATVGVAASAVVAGDFIGHRTGRFLGVRLRTGRLGRRIPATAWSSAENLMDRRGGQAVLLSRFVPVIRTLTPHLAGATRLPYRRIAPYSVLAAPLWAGAEIGTGYAAATTLRQVLAVGAPACAAMVAGIIAATLIWKALRRRYRARRPGRAGAVPSSTLGAVEAVQDSS